MHPLKIDMEYKQLIPPLSDDEFRLLEENIISEGQCRDAIKTWKNTIIDGHNRYAICQKHSIPYKTATLHFKSRNDAMLWIADNQLGRRNLTDAVRIKLELSKAEMLRKSSQQNGNMATNKITRKSIADKIGVSENTVHKYMKIKQVGSPELAKRVENGELKIGTAYNMLDVVIKTVEPIPVEEVLQDLSNPFFLSGVQSNIARICNLYKFICGNVEFVSEDADEVIKRLRAQLGVAMAISDGFA